MNILFLSQIIPYPPDAGPKVKTWHVLRYLAGQGHAITLLAFVRPEEMAHVQSLHEVCRRVETVPITRSRLRDVGYLLKSQLSGRPFLVERDDLAAMRRAVTAALRREPFDVVYCDQLTMTQFVRTLPPGSGARRIFDAHNATWAITERMGANAPLPLRAVLALETRRIVRYESAIVRGFEHTLAVTDIDRDALLHAVAATDGAAAAAAHAARIVTVPITIDTERYRPIPRPNPGPAIMTLGTLHYPPNADGIRWFVDDVLPLVRARIPDATLTIVGKNPPADLLRRAQHDPAVTVTGYVPSLTPYMAAAGTLVVPVRAGGGMRVRILEAFACAMPVVTTTVGLEGIDAVPGRDVLVADTPADFADAVVRLLQDDALNRRLAAAGRALVTAVYDWQAALPRLDPLFGDR